MKKLFCAALFAVAPVLAFGPAGAATLTALVESDTNRGPGDEIASLTFDTYADVIAGVLAGGGLANAQLDLAANFSVGGLAYDGKYRLLIERDTDAAAGSEITSLTFDTYNDLLTGNFALFGLQTTQIDLAANFSVAGLAYDGKYRLLIERDTDAVAGSEITSLTYDTYADLIAGNFALFGLEQTQIDLAATFNVGGLAYDGKYRMLIERDTDAAAGSEVTSLTYDTYADLVAGNFALFGLEQTQLDIGAGYSVGGFAYGGFPAAPVPVPLPAGLPLLLAGLGGLGLIRRRPA